jgi:hypothetical protein
MASIAIANITRTREGLIALASGVAYTAVGLLATYLPGSIPLSGFFAWLCLFMPVPLAFVLLQIDGFKKGFQSSWFNTAMVTLAALVPIVVSLKSRFL